MAACNFRSLLTSTGGYSDDDDDDDDENDNMSTRNTDIDNVDDKIDDATSWQEVRKTQKRRHKPTVSDPQKKSKTCEDDDNGTMNNKNNSAEVEPNHVVYIKGESTRLTSCNPYKISRDINSSFGAVLQIQTRGVSLKITCVSNHQREQILQSTRLGEHVIVASRPNSERRAQQEATQQRFQQVVIGGVPLDVGEEEIKEATGSKQVRRITKRNSLGDKVDTSAVVLSYDCSVEEVPPRVHMGFLTFKTRVYIPLVTRCYKCQKYGHIAVNCRKEKPTCPVCSGPHSYSECQTKDDKKCANCGGAHSTSFRECPKYILAKKVTHRAATEHMSYRDALLRLRQEERAKKTNIEGVVNNNGDTMGSQPTRSSLQQQMNSSAIQVGEINQDTVITKATIGTQYDVADADIAEDSPVPLLATTKHAVSKHNTDYSTDTLSGEALYQLLAMFLKLHEDDASQSELTECILKFLTSKLNRPGDSIQKGILLCRDNTGKSISTNVSIASRSRSRSSKNAARGVRANLNSSSNTVSTS